MNWTFSGAAIITLLLFTFNAQTTKAQNRANSTSTASATSSAAAPLLEASSDMVPSRRATIIVRIVTASGTPLKQQAVVQLFSGAGTTPAALAATKTPAHATFHGLQSHHYTVRASAVGYRTAEIHLQTYRHDTYYQAIVHLKPDPVAPPTFASLPPKAEKEAEAGLVEYESGNFREATKHFDQALRTAPQSPNLSFLLGVSLLNSNDLQRAQSLLQHATHLDPHHVPSLVALGRVRLQQGQFTGAAAPLRKAVSLSPTSWAPHLLLASADLGRREFVSALRESREAIRLGRGAASSGHLIEGEAFAAQGQSRQAQQTLRSFVRKSPYNPAAPAARELLTRLQQNDPPANAELASAALISAKTVPLADPAASGIPWHSWRSPSVDDARIPIANGLVCPMQTVLDKVTHSVDSFVADVNRFDAQERIVNYDINSSGRVFSTEKRKFDYVVSMTKLPGGTLNVDESRNGIDGGFDDFPDHIATLGLPALALVFHQDYRAGYRFDCEGLAEWGGQATWLMLFRQRAGRIPRIRGYNVDGKLYPVALTGRAWIHADNFQIVHIEADLIQPVPKIKLRYEHQAITYGPVGFQQGHTELWLPKRASLYFYFGHHRYHRVHAYSHYLLFSVTASEKISAPEQVAMKQQREATNSR